LTVVLYACEHDPACLPMLYLLFTEPNFPVLTQTNLVSALSDEGSESFFLCVSCLDTETVGEPVKQAFQL